MHRRIYYVRESPAFQKYTFEGLHKNVWYLQLVLNGLQNKRINIF